MSEVFLTRAVGYCVGGLASRMGGGSSAVGAVGGLWWVAEATHPLLLAKMEVSSSKSALKDAKLNSSSPDDEKAFESGFASICLDDAAVAGPERRGCGMSKKESVEAPTWYDECGRRDGCKVEAMTITELM